MPKTKFRPLHDRVLVRRIDSKKKTKGGIISQRPTALTPRTRNMST
jgi:co-chaperonin GroES (HSP10)